MSVLIFLISPSALTFSSFTLHFFLKVIKDQRYLGWISLVPKLNLDLLQHFFLNGSSQQYSLFFEWNFQIIFSKLCVVSRITFMLLGIYHVIKT